MGPASIDALSKLGINTTFQLFGKYLALKGENITPKMHADLFHDWLKNDAKTASGYTSTVVMAVGEKLNITYNGLFSLDDYGDAKPSGV